MKYNSAIILVIVCILLTKNLSASLKNEKKSGNYKKVISKIPRNGVYYTQGLFFDSDSTVIESGGLYKESVLVRMEYPSMKVIKKVHLADKYFAEGTTKCGNNVYQLTWENFRRKHCFFRAII